MLSLNPSIRLLIQQTIDNEYGKKKSLCLITAQNMESIVLVGIEVDFNGEQSRVDLPLKILELEEYILTKGRKDYSIFDPFEKIAPGMLGEIFSQNRNDKIQFDINDSIVEITISEAGSTENVKVSFENFKKVVLTIIEFKKLFGEWGVSTPGTGDPVDALMEEKIDEEIRIIRGKRKPTDSSGPQFQDKKGE